MSEIQRYIVKSDGACPDAIVEGMSWLVSRGGGTAVFPSAGALTATFPETRTPAGRRRLLDGLEAAGVRVDCTRGRIYVADDISLLAYPTARMLEDYESIAEWAHPSAVLVVSWNRDSCEDWNRRFSPEEVLGGHHADEQFRAICDACGVKYW